MINRWRYYYFFTIVCFRWVFVVIFSLTVVVLHKHGTNYLKQSSIIQITTNDVIKNDFFMVALQQ